MKKLMVIPLLVLSLVGVALAIPQTVPTPRDPKIVMEAFRIECTDSRHLAKLLALTGEQVVLKGTSEHPQAPGFTVLLTMAKDGSYTWVIENQTNGRGCIVDYGKMQPPGRKS